MSTIETNEFNWQLDFNRGKKKIKLLSSVINSKFNSQTLFAEQNNTSTQYFNSWHFDNTLNTNKQATVSANSRADRHIPHDYLIKFIHFPFPFHQLIYLYACSLIKA